ncbi:hypothetical protein GYMLUDRAFT_98121 [Collybiopsis luxurians FD-317 M1]|uniref:DNA-binding protein RAP1 n=1 Tax=Collybiopsis luxurians FD-317 M1 TaxID=944289 RepID=A0A0D0CRE4_9AGAR|nr:hypothetical protein GYMLUDRAFT_98121 [Collybiopsis luxurians FD-317 M1]
MDADNSDSEQLIFTRDGEPVKFVLHTSIRAPGAIKALVETIWEHGGDVLESDEGADIILINPSRPNINQGLFQSAYDRHPDPQKNKIWVKEMSFVRDCIDRGFLFLDFPPKKAKPGLPPGSGRTPFTSEDKENLCKYLATILPDRGGRLGHNIYKEMMKLSNYMPPTYSWVTRHTAQSWREHYKKNQAELDTRIDDIVAEMGPNPKAAYYRDRLWAKDSEKDIGPDDGEEMDIMADEAETLLIEQTSQDQTSNTPAKRKGKRRAVKTEDEAQVEEKQPEATSPRRPKPKPRPRKRPRSHSDRPVPSKESGPSQTLVDIVPVEHSKSPIPAGVSPMPEELSQDDQIMEGIRETGSPAILEEVQANTVFRRPRRGPMPESEPPSTSAENPLPPSRDTRHRARSRSGSVDPTTTAAPAPGPNTRARARSRSAALDPEPAPVPSSSRRKGKAPANRGVLASQPLSSLRETSQEAEAEAAADTELRRHSSLFSDSESQERRQRKGTQGNELNDEDHSESESEDDRQLREMIAKAREQTRDPATPKRGRGRPPKNRQPSVAVSETSVSDMIPIAGTRASTERKKMVRKARYDASYTPIPGTKAARQIDRVRG